MKRSLLVYSMLILAALSFVAFETIPQENPLLKSIIDKLLIYNTNEGPEKTYVHTDKDFYTNGETIWFKTYLVDGISHTQSNKSKVVYVDLVNTQDSVIVRRKLYSDAMGASGDIQLDRNIPQGTYKLRSYTKYMLNDNEPVFFQKEIPIVTQKIKASADFENFKETSLRNYESETTSNESRKFGKPKVRFFPEGGNLVEGISTVLGIEVTDAKNNGIALRGVIRDSEGKTIIPFESLEFGLGKVNFKPFPKKSYYASIEIDGIEQKFELPEIKTKGYGLSIKNQGDHMYLQVVGNTEYGVNETVLIAHLRGKLIFKRVGKSEDKDAYAVKLFNKELLDGVAQFTLFAPNGEPVCERLVFVDNPSNDSELSIRSNAKSFGHREKVSLDLALTDNNGHSIGGDFSMGVVTSYNRLENKSNGSDIRSWLLLSSDLGGTIPNPGFFFENSSYERKYLLDALMLTHGWRRFIWADMLNKKKNEVLTYHPEKGIMISGKTTAFNNQFSSKKTVTFLSTFGENLFNEQQSTDDQGRFSFGPFIFTDSLKGVIHAIDSLERKAKQKNISIFLDPLQLQIVSKENIQRKINKRTIAYNNDYLKQAYRKKVADFKFNPSQVTQLDEVVVTEKKKTRNEVMTEAMRAELTSGMFAKRLYTDSIPGSQTDSAFDLLRRVAGVFVKGIYPQQEVEIRGKKVAPLFLLDGIVTPMDRVQEMRANEVLFVDILKGSAASVFGSRGLGGAIAFYTDRGLRFDDEKRPETPGISNFKIPGFYKTREFYQLNYSDLKKEHEKPDYRTTLFWEPDVRLDDNGSSSVDFYTGDSSGSYVVKVEGMTHDGRPVSGFYTIEVDESN